MPNKADKLICVYCGGNAFEQVAAYTAPPPDETQFSFNRGNDYRRQLFQCEGCGHFLSIHNMDMSDLYSGEYVDATYSGSDGLHTSFERIIGLPPEDSDNRQRVKRICNFVLPLPDSPSEIPTLLDVGAGLGVFPYVMKEAGWDCTALDPDPRSVKHIQETVGIHGICGDFLEIDDPGRFDLITFNKVLEHVLHPVSMLRKASDYLKPGGYVYVELPDGESAILDTPLREEFTIDHPHVFSAASFSLLVHQAGFAIERLERLREPSSKYTLFAFLQSPTVNRTN